MRSILYFCAIPLFIQSCKIEHQVFEVHSRTVIERLIDKEEVLVFENDTLRITYDFWNDAGGTLGFQIFNKSKKPIYIDWARSNFIYNGYSQDYFQDREESKFIGAGNQYRTSYGSAVVARGFSVVTKEKPAVQIPPSSAIFIQKFNLNHGWIPGKINKNEKYTTWEFTQENTTLNFRNYIACSFENDFKNEFFIDNEFWIGKGFMIRNKAYYNGEFPYKPKKQFHLKRETGNSLAITVVLLLTLFGITIISAA